MKRIRKSRAARIVSWLLTMAMITPLFTGLAPRASAQNQVQTGGVQTVIVLDFTNKAGPAGAALTRLVTDAVSVEMSNSGRYESLKRDEVLRQANELGLKAPYDQVAKQRLAAALGANAIVDGAIETVHDNVKNGGRSVEVGITVRVSEATSGDLLGGAAQIGTARARPGQTDPQSLAQEAANNAAIQSVKQILTYNLPEGTVINTVGGGTGQSLQVLINRGSRDGVTSGMEMIVLREGRRVAKIKIGAVYPTDSEATVEDIGMGIQPQDRVRAVFPMPTITGRGEIAQERQHTNPRSSMSALGKILLVLLVGVVIATAAKGGSSSVTGVTAEAEIVAAAQPTPAVRIIWRDNFFGSGTSLEYHIWRSPDVLFNYVGVPVAAVQGGSHQYDDRNGFIYFSGPPIGFLQPGFPTQSGNNGGGGGGGGGTGTAATVVPTTGPAGPVPGQTYTYMVSAVVERQTVVQNTGGGNGGGGGGGGNGNQGGVQDLETNTVNSGPATPLNPPALQTPRDAATSVQLATVTISWLSVAGADLYQIEISSDRTFRNPNLIFRQQVFSTAPNGAGILQTATLNLSNDPTLRRDPTYAAFVDRKSLTKPTLFVRVGARNSGDRPGPVNFLSLRHDDPDQTFRFIYSNPARSFTPADLPPPPPGG